MEIQGQALNKPYKTYNHSDSDDVEHLDMRRKDALVRPGEQPV